MRIKVQEVGPVTKEGKYFWFNLKYEDSGKEFNRKITSFNKVPYESFKEAKEGEQYDVKIEKDKNGYWQWVEVNLAKENSAASASGARQWVPDDVRQRMIVRQSSIGHAVEIIKHTVKPEDATVQQVLDVAGELEAWVNRE